MSVSSEISEYLGESLVDESPTEDRSSLSESRSPLGEHVDTYLSEAGRRDDANFRNVKGLKDDVARVLDKNFSHPNTPFWAKSVKPGSDCVAEIDATFDDDVDRIYRERGKLEQDLDTGLRPYGYYPRVEIKGDKSGAKIKLMKMS